MTDSRARIAELWNDDVDFVSHHGTGSPEDFVVVETVGVPRAAPRAIIVVFELSWEPGLFFLYVVDAAGIETISVIA